MIPIQTLMQALKWSAFGLVGSIDRLLKPQKASHLPSGASKLGLYLGLPPWDSKAIRDKIGN